MLWGFLVMFFIQRFLHFHHHDVPEGDPESDTECCTHDHDHSHGPAHSHNHDSEHPHDHSLASRSAKNLSWSGAALGLTLHTLIDGIALAASVEVESHDGQAGMLLGFGTFLVVILHKPFDALAIATLMAASGWSKLSRHIVNALFAIAIPAGIVLFHMGAGICGGDFSLHRGERSAARAAISLARSREAFRSARRGIGRGESHRDLRDLGARSHPSR
jgi:zinc and cadmium transporter